MADRLVAYLATVGDVWFDGDRIFFDSLRPEEAATDGAELRRFDAAVHGRDDADLVVVLTEEDENTLGVPGTARMKPFFTAWGERNRPVDFRLIPNSTEPDRQYARQSTLLDGWQTEYRGIDLFLGGADSITDALAWLSSLDGSHHPPSVVLHFFRDTVLDDAEYTTIRKDVTQAVSRELTREHTHSRINRWEFIETGALAGLHEELHDVGGLLKAASRYLQRNDRDLDAVEVDRHTAVLGEFTADLCHAVDIAEHLMTVGRREEELAWMIMLATTDLAPAAWAERRLPGDGEILPRIKVWADERYPGELASDGSAVLDAFGEAVNSPLAPAVRFLAVHAAGTRLPPDADAAQAFALWLAVRRGLRRQRDKLAFLFHDLNGDSLKQVLREAAATASAELTGVLAHSPSSEDLSYLDEIEQGRAEPPETGAVSGTGTRRVLARSQASGQLTPQDVDDMLTSILSGAHDAPPERVAVYAYAVQRMRADGYGDHAASALQAYRNKRRPDRPLGLSSADQQAIRGLLTDEDGLSVEPLSSDTSSPLRNILEVFAAEAAHRPNPLIEIKDRVVQQLTDHS